MVNGQVIHQDDCPDPELGNQYLLDVEQEHIRIDTTDNAHRGNKSINAHATNQRDILPSIAGRFCVIQAFASRSTTVQTGKSEDRYLYRAVDSQGNTLDFLLTAKHNAQAAKRFFCKALNAVHIQEPRVINADKNAAYPKTIDDLKEKEDLFIHVKLR